jgi:hypothetical protein
MVSALSSQQSLVANCLRQTYKTFDSSIQLVEDHIPVSLDIETYGSCLTIICLKDELKMFNALLYPLIRLSSCRFISALDHGLDISSGPSSSKNEGEDTEHHGIIRSFLAMSGSSSRTLSQLKGLEVHARELCNIWTDRLTVRFQLSSFEWFREKTGARHEYLVFNLKSDESRSKDLWLRLERRPREEIMRKRDTLTRLVGWFEAHDSITISHQKTNVLHRDNMEAELQASVTFDGWLSLAYLVKVLKIIHEESPEYHLAGVSVILLACLGQY